MINRMAMIRIIENDEVYEPGRIVFRLDSQENGIINPR
jgi:hypothetical protein